MHDNERTIKEFPIHDLNSLLLRSKWTHEGESWLYIDTLDNTLSYLKINTELYI